MSASVINRAAVARVMGIQLSCARCRARYLVLPGAGEQFAAMACPACEEEIKRKAAAEAPAWADTAKRTALGVALVAAAFLSWTVLL